MDVKSINRAMWFFNKIIEASRYGGISRDELIDKWEQSCHNDYDGDKKRLKERTFYRVIDEIESLFNCEVSGRDGKYKVVEDYRDSSEPITTILDFLLKRGTQDEMMKLVGMLFGANSGVTTIRALKEMLDGKEAEYAQQFISIGNSRGIKGADNIKKDAVYTRNYVCVWDEATYQRTDQWLSIGFYLNDVYFYVVTDEEDYERREHKAKQIGLGQGRYYRDENYWHEFVDRSLFQLSFDNAPDMEAIISHTEKLLAMLSKVEVEEKRNRELTIYGSIG